MEQKAVIMDENAMRRAVARITYEILVVQKIYVSWAFCPVALCLRNGLLGKFTNWNRSK